MISKKQKILNFSKRRLAMELGKRGLPNCFSYHQRALQLKKGILPKEWDFHHILPKCDGGKDNIYNLSAILRVNHERLNKYIERVRNIQPVFVEEYRPVLKKVAEKYGALTL